MKFFRSRLSEVKAQKDRQEQLQTAIINDATFVSGEDAVVCNEG